MVCCHEPSIVEESRMYVPRSSPSSDMPHIAYSDGAAAEAQILSLVKAHADRSSEAAIGQEHYADWPVKYHLCPERGNLLRHLCFDGLTVLELGAGMGGVSRLLAERAKSLTVVEGTESRFAVLASRLRGLDNWSGQVANIEDISLPERFDVVCVVGVLEYAEQYLHPPADFVGDAFAWFLRIAAAQLKQDGVLILAIENKLGLKYWSGAVEDHTGRMFDGICGYPTGQKSPRTFSRNELLAILNASGLVAIEEHYPFPDYKTPNAVISRKLMQLRPDIATGLATLRPFLNHDGGPRLRFFPEALAVASVSDAGLLPEFSNSFLFIASSRDSSATYQHVLSGPLERGELAWCHSNYRRIPMTTVFSLFGNRSAIYVTKRAMRSEDKPATIIEGSGLRVQWNGLAASALVGGVESPLAMARQAYFDGAESWYRLLVAFIEWSFQKWQLNDAGAGTIDGRALDAIINNSRRLDGSAGGFELFDLEWQLLGPMPKSWFILRNVLEMRLDYQLLCESPSCKTLRQVYERLTRDLGIIPDLKADAAREAEFQSLVTNYRTADQHRVRILAELNARIVAIRFPRRTDREEVYIRALLESRVLRCCLNSARWAYRVSRWACGRLSEWRFGVRQRDRRTCDEPGVLAPANQESPCVDGVGAMR
jgi:SAM-dependent methyltransferase